MGINPKDIQVVLGYDETKPQLLEDWRKLERHYKNVSFYFYTDTREWDNDYPPSLQSHILSKHWKENPWMAKEMVFFHDADVIFTRPFDFSPYLNDKIWYLSDTVSYIGSEYIQSKGERVLDKMCEVAKIDKQLVIDNQPNSGGAQKLIKFVPPQYWDEVFDMSMNLWKEIPPLSAEIKKEKGNSYHVLQHWTMSMWGELWQAWKWGKPTKVVKEFDFHFAIDNIDTWEDKPFFHNAGVLGNQTDTHFFKGLFDNKLPYGYELKNPNKDIVGWKYYQFIQEVGKKSVLI